MSFAYTAKDPLGKIFRGSLDVPSAEEARQQLRRDGFDVVQVEEEEESGLFPRRIRRGEIVHFTSQLAIMVDTGITLSVALDSIAQQEENPTFKSVMGELRSSVEAGESFSNALTKHPKHFDRTFVAMIRASEQTGGLAEMLDTISNYLRKQMQTRSKVKSAMAYPSVMALMAVGVTIFLLTFVLPKFAPLFERKGASLPTPTLVMMAASEALLGYWYLWILGSVALAIGILYGRRTERGRMAIDWTKINAPIVGAMFRKIAISRSMQTLGTMLAAGVSVIDALRLCSEVAGNIFYERLWLRVLHEVTSGNRICEALAGDPLFPSALVQMIGSGEETAKLDEVLQKVSLHYDHEVDTALKTATSIIEPLMIMVMGVVVGGIALGLLLPIFSLSRGG